MKIPKTLTLLSLSLVFATTVVFADSKANYLKLDPMLRIVSQKAMSVNGAKSLNMLKEVPHQEVMVKTLIRFKENLNGVDALGGKIGSIIGDIATVDIPLSSLEALSQLENIVYVEVSKKVKPKLDISVPETRATLLRGSTPPAWMGITGKDVIVGIVDSGIDLTHPDFKDAAGKTRILYLLDQTTDQECTNTMIDNGTCFEKDTDGHGTHVAGIAAGNGSASNYKYVGMAPEANLIIVKTTFDGTDILNGVSYIQQKATSLGRPSVINLSLGGHVDPHDGTSNFSRSLDNASGAGLIIVGAAGNEADAGIHASGHVTQGSQTLEAFLVPPMESMVVIDIWYSGNDSMNVEVTTPRCGNTGWIAPNENQDFTKACGNISISSLQNNPNNGDNEILIMIENSLAPWISAGRWNFSLQGSSITNGRFDAWIDDTVTFATFVYPDSSMTLTDVGSTTRVISAGSYVTRPYYEDDPAAGNISTFSSHGPRRSCSTCQNVLKPEITAPGQWIMSALSKDYVPYFDDVVDSSGEYILFQGTSMSSPHVAGAVVLMLQAKSTFTPEDIKYYLSLTTKRDRYTGSVPNYTWGNGKLDAYDAVLGLSGQYTLTVIINPTGSGSVTKNPNKSNYDFGDQVQLTPTPTAGYSFNNWSGDASGNTNPLTLTMTGSKTITANFSAPKISVTPTAYAFGNVKVKRSKTASFKVTNSGTANLIISSTSIKGTDTSMFTITSGSGSKTIKPGKTLTIGVAFKPTSAGSKTSALEITSNDPITPSVDIPLSGTGQ